LITRNENGDAPFAFAVSNREVTAFLRQARQAFQAVTSECVSMTDRLRQDEDRTEAQERARQAALAETQRNQRERALAMVVEARETRLAVAVLLLFLAFLSFGAAGLMFFKDRRRPALLLAGAGGVLLIGATVAFLTRPSFADAEEVPVENGSAAAAEPTRFAGRNTCELVEERSRVTISSTDPVPLEWNESGCVNQRTQYARNGDVWTRILVPGAEQAVSVLEFRPASGEYVVSRYLLDAAAMERVRALRRDVDVKSCTADSEARTILSNQLREIGQVLPRLPNERLVYSCRNQGSGAAVRPVAGGSG
jgi:hypothetical protein